MWYCETCKKDININTKSSHIKSAAPIENEVLSIINNKFTGVSSFVKKFTG